jgi:hypothetical protein
MAYANIVDPIAVVIAVLVVGVLLAGIPGMPFRALIDLQGYDMGVRLHWNTKNTTRSIGDSLGEVAA